MRVVRVVGRMGVEAMMTAAVEGMVRMRWVVRVGSTCRWAVPERLTVGSVGLVLSCVLWWFGDGEFGKRADGRCFKCGRCGLLVDYWEKRKGDMGREQVDDGSSRVISLHRLLVWDMDVLIAGSGGCECRGWIRCWIGTQFRKDRDV